MAFWTSTPSLQPDSKGIYTLHWMCDKDTLAGMDSNPTVAQQLA